MAVIWFLLAVFHLIFSIWWSWAAIAMAFCLGMLITEKLIHIYQVLNAIHRLNIEGLKK